MRMPNLRPAEAILVLVRVLLGGWFLRSGLLKIFGGGLDKFTRDIANYKMVGAPLDAIAAYSIPWIECAAGLCLILGLLRKGAVMTLAGLVTVFAVAIGWAWSKGLDIACGCHGGDEPIHYWGKAAELAFYYVLLGMLWRVETQQDAAARVESDAAGVEAA
jgi:uncharacterized membrane protein YphA (DoxX/SURF4 family)